MKLNKEFKNIGFILDKSQFDGYQKICQRLSFEESILEYNHHKFKQIDFLKKNYLKPDLYKHGNILLIPYHSNDFSWYLSPWQILNTDNGTILHCKHVLFKSCFDKNNSNIWKYSSIRKLLNSNKFLKKFPVSIQNNISFHDIWTDQKITSNRFWLLSWQDLGYIAKKKCFKTDYSSKKTFYDSNIFKTRKDLTKYFTDWWVASLCSLFQF